MFATLPSSRGLPRRLLQMEGPAPLKDGASPDLAGQGDHRDPQAIPWHLRGSRGHRGAQVRSRGSDRPKHGSLDLEDAMDRLEGESEAEDEEQEDGGEQVTEVDDD